MDVRDPELYRRRIARMTTGREVADYVYTLECGHEQGGDTGMTHKQAQRRKTVICQNCRREALDAARGQR